MAVKYRETNTVVSSIGMAATQPAAPSSPATCPPLRTPTKNPSNPTCLFFLLRANAAGSAKRRFYLYDYGEVNMFSRSR